MISLNCPRGDISQEMVKDMEANPNKHGYSFAISFRRYDTSMDCPKGTQYTCGTCHEPVVVVFKMDEERPAAFAIPFCIFCEEDDNNDE